MPDGAALLLDLDGTLIDIAPTPDSVIVPPELPPTLRRLRGRLRDAVAIVTGRPVNQVEALLGDAPYAVAGEHGAALRFAPGAALVRTELRAVPEGWVAQAERAIAAHPGALLEHKSSGFVLHYRLAPEAGPALRQALLSIVGEAEDRWVVMRAHMAWELKPRGVDKGTAVAALLEHPPFAGRVPVYVGDDVTDEDGMRAARHAGGMGLRVQDVFGDPAGVRSWLGRLADGAA
jgi:trehalose 6-phosphate phosphatase